MPLSAAQKMVSKAVQRQQNAGALLWQRFRSAASETGNAPLQQMAYDLYRRQGYQNTSVGTKQFLQTFSQQLGGRKPFAIWSAFSQQPWSRSTLQHLAEALNRKAAYPQLQEPARQNFARAAAILASAKSPAALDEIRFVKDVLARAKTGTASKDAIIKARDTAKLLGRQADFQALSRYAGSGTKAVLPLVIGTGTLFGLALLLRKA